MLDRKRGKLVSPDDHTSGGADHKTALKRYTFLALVLVGCAMLILDQDSSRFGRVSKFVWMAEHPNACSRVVTPPTTVHPPVIVHPQLVSTARVSSLRFRFNNLHGRVRSLVARLQAEECCWLNSLGQELHGKPSATTSPAWRDVHYDAQQLARMLGLCKQEPV